MPSPNLLRDNVARVCDRIATAASRAGRHPSEITLIGVSKTHPAEMIRAAYDAGLRDFGENRVQEWEGKRQALTDLADARWHLIGHLQSNKATRAATIFHSVDSVDDAALAQRLDRTRQGTAAAQGPLRVLLEVHIAGEAAKSGAEPEDLPELAEAVTKCASLHLNGLMCVPPLLDDVEKVRPYFRKLRELRDRLETHIGHKLPVLSMGMSHDFEVAIEEGATEVRVGTALFGERPAPKKR
ncbi:MAG: YggS family pyridoxal phosphate-dependent enzyme [Acidobacteria bacterium]|nr:YggS family pyridoxal phosphate-dependent enzyme [Acidobacteriota bacterium]